MVRKQRNRESGPRAAVEERPAESKAIEETAAESKSPEAKSVDVAATNLTPEDRRFLEEHRDALSRSTLHARFIHSPDEHEDHPGQTLATRSHAVIQRWAQERNAQPTTAPGTEREGRPGVLRFDFPGYGGRELPPVSWDEWLRTFDERQLVFLYQEHLRDGRPSNFFQLDTPERERE